MLSVVSLVEGSTLCVVLDDCASVSVSELMMLCWGFLFFSTHYLSLSDLLIVSSGQDCICLAPINMYFTFFLSI